MEDAVACPICLHPQRREIDLYLFSGYTPAQFAKLIKDRPDYAAMTSHKVEGHMQVDTPLVCAALIELTEKCRSIVEKSLVTGNKKREYMTRDRQVVTDEGGNPFMRKAADVTQQFGATALRMQFQVMLIHAKLQGVGEDATEAHTIKAEDMKALLAYMEHHDSDAAVRAARVISRRVDAIDVLPKTVHAAEKARVRARQEAAANISDAEVVEDGSGG